MPPPLTQRRDPSGARVLQILHEEDKDATLARVPSARKDIPSRKPSSSSPSSDDAKVEGLKPISPLGFSQPSAPEREEPGPRSALSEGGFSQFFSQGRTRSDIFDESPPNVKVCHIFLRTALMLIVLCLQTHNLLAQRSKPAAGEEGEFEFTQPNALLPSVRISESQRREVDEMFGKDQEFKLDEAKRSRNQAKDGSTR